MSDRTPRAEPAKTLGGAYFYTPFDALFVEELKMLVPAHARKWEPKPHYRWYINADYLDVALEIAQRYYPDFDDLTAGPQRAKSQRGWGQAPPPPAQSPIYAQLYVTSDAPSEVIRAAYKALALMHHPDRGGSVKHMQAINTAYAELQKRGLA